MDLLNAYHDHYSSHSTAINLIWQGQKKFLYWFAKVHDGRLAVSSTSHNHLSAIWIPDPALNSTDRALLQTKRFCSGYNTACLTFSTASLLRKLCNCCTGFFFKKRSLPKWDQMTFLPTRSETISREQAGRSIQDPPATYTFVWLCNKLHITGTVVVEQRCVCLCPDEAAAWATFSPDTKYSSF